MALALEPLHSSPDLIEDTISLLKEEWPECLAERLRHLETSQCRSVPCSLVLTESREGAAKEVIGHARITRIHPESENRIYLESVTIRKTRRGEGLGSKIHDLAEEYAKNILKAQFIHVSVTTESNSAFYDHLRYDRYAQATPQIAPNMLRTCCCSTWKGVIVPEEYRYLYEAETCTHPKPNGKFCRHFLKNVHS